MDRLPQEIIYLLMAIAGGFAKVAQSIATGERISIIMAVAHVIVSAFSGLMFAIFLELLGMTGNGRLLAAGMGGWLGVEALHYIARKLQK